MYNEFLNIDHLVISKRRITRSSKVKKEYYSVVVSDELFRYLTAKNIKIMDEDEFPAAIVSIESNVASFAPFLSDTDEPMYVSVPKSIATKIKLMF